MAREIDDQYFRLYGKGKGYKNAWANHTLHPRYFWGALDLLHVNAQSVLDIGAANGRWMNALNQWIGDSFEPAENPVRFQGLEINENMAKSNVSRFPIEVGDVRNGLPEGDFDVICFNGLAYLTREEIGSLLTQARKVCKVFECGFVTWDNRPLLISDLDEPYEKTLMVSADWNLFFRAQGWMPRHMNGFWFLTPNPEEQDPQTLGNPWFLYHDSKNATHKASGIELEHIKVDGQPRLKITLPKQTLGVPNHILSLSWRYLEIHVFDSQTRDFLVNQGVQWDMDRECFCLLRL